MKRNVLVIDGGFLAIVGTIAGITDIVAYTLGIGPFGQTYFQNNIVIGGFEAHSLAVIVGLILILKSKSPDAAFFNKIAAANHIVLGTSNLIWFEIFYETGSVAMGYLTTIVHFTLVILNMVAVYRSDKRGSDQPANGLIKPNV